MTRFLASTAVLFALSTPLAAQQGIFVQSQAEGDMFGTNLIGQRLYVSEAEMETGGVVTPEMLGEWDDVGEIGDVLVSQDGQIKAVLLDIGGFLGIGERTVAVDMAQLRFLRDENDPNDVFVAISGTQESLETAPEFERLDMVAEPVAAQGAAGTAVVPVTTETVPETTATENNAEMTEGETVEVQTIEVEEEAEVEMETETTAMAPVMVDDSMRMTRPEVMRDGYAMVERQDLTTEMLTGARVYGIGDEDIGEVSELIMGTDGQIAQAVVDVGGFLGMGENPVAIDFDEMQILRDDDGNDLRVYIDASEEALEQRPIYEN